jgi:peptide/nickel transport system ATP-binding protein
MKTPLLRIEDLTLTFTTPKGVGFPVHGLNLEIYPGETVALLGESGCGKSLTALSLMQLLPPGIHLHPDAHIFLDGTDLTRLPEVSLRALRGRKIAMIFQEPMTSLNPVMTVGDQLVEVLRLHTDLPASVWRARSIELLDMVGINEAAQHVDDYPHQFSGGMKQRVMIAMALAGEPDLLIADEPTTALDVTIQAQILQLMHQLQKRTGMAILLITHDLGVAQSVADRICVMYAGHLIEAASAEAFFENPKHPYSQGLLATVPSFTKRAQRLEVITGQVPALTETLPACRFAARCSHAWDLCFTAVPRYLVSGEHAVRCHLYDSDLSHPIPTGTPQAAPSLANNQEKPSAELCLSVNDLRVYYPIRRGLLKRIKGWVKAVDGVSFELHKGKTLAVVGESGSGKTTLARTIMRLIRETSGDINYHNQEPLHQWVQIIFQDPFSAMNPRLRVGDIISEGMRAQKTKLSAVQREQRVIALLKQVGLPAEAINRYPHQFSGGQRQRIGIARALAVNPKLIICDEPTSALDVSVQAQIINLLKSLQEELGIAYLFITHNLSVVSYLADEVLIMQAGHIVEQGPITRILKAPQHPYTRELLAAAGVLLESQHPPSANELDEIRLPL